MGTTANRSYPYPDPTDAADMAGALEDLARAVDTDVQALVDLTSLPPMAVISGDDPTLNRINSGTATNMVYTTVNYDNGCLGSALPENSLTVAVEGAYLVHFNASVPDVTTRLEAFLRIAGVDYGRALHEGNAPSRPRLSICALVPLIGTGMQITTTVTQNTGAVQSILGPRLMLYKFA